jgi:hypothetical protein
MPIGIEFQRRYATIVLELEQLNKDLNKVLHKVQQYCYEVSGVYCFHWCFVLFCFVILVFFEMGSHSVAMAALETSLASSSEIRLFLPPSAGIKGVRHHAQPNVCCFPSMFCYLKLNDFTFTFCKL